MERDERLQRQLIHFLGPRCETNIPVQYLTTSRSRSLGLSIPTESRLRCFHIHWSILTQIALENCNIANSYQPAATSLSSTLHGSSLLLKLNVSVPPVILDVFVASKREAHRCCLEQRCSGEIVAVRAIF